MKKVVKAQVQMRLDLFIPASAPSETLASVLGFESYNKETILNLSLVTDDQNMLHLEGGKEIRLVLFKYGKITPDCLLLSLRRHTLPLCSSVGWHCAHVLCKIQQIHLQA